jgi:hypothetical protein
VVPWAAGVVVAVRVVAALPVGRLVIAEAPIQ